MEDNRIDQTNQPEDNRPEMLVNDYGATKDPAVVVDEADRTVLLTENETIVIDKEPRYDIVPRERPRKVYAGMWGQAEIATVGLAVLAVLSVVLLYVFLVVPSRNELDRQRAERDRLEQELTSSRDKYGSFASIESQVAKLVESVDGFESNYLPIASTGRTALYQRINGLIASHGLLNTSGPDFTPLEMAENVVDTERAEQDRGRAKFKSIFPGVYVTMTLEGSYQNLRRFIREIEAGQEFVIVSSVELEPTDGSQKQEDPAATQAQNPTQYPVYDASNPSGFSGGRNPASGFPSGRMPGIPGGRMPQPVVQQPVIQQAKPKGKTHGEVVSLRLEMAAYFRRANTAPLATETFAQ